MRFSIWNAFVAELPPLEHETTYYILDKGGSVKVSEEYVLKGFREEWLTLSDYRVDIWGNIHITYNLA